MGKTPYHAAEDLPSNRLGRESNAASIRPAGSHFEKCAPPSNAKGGQGARGFRTLYPRPPWSAGILPAMSAQREQTFAQLPALLFQQCLARLDRTRPLSGLVEFTFCAKPRMFVSK